MSLVNLIFSFIVPIFCLVPTATQQLSSFSLDELATEVCLWLPRAAGNHNRMFYFLCYVSDTILSSGMSGVCSYVSNSK